MHSTIIHNIKQEGVSTTNNETKWFIDCTKDSFSSKYNSKYLNTSEQSLTIKRKIFITYSFGSNLACNGARICLFSSRFRSSTINLSNSYQYLLHLNRTF